MTEQKNVRYAERQRGGVDEPEVIPEAATRTWQATGFSRRSRSSGHCVTQAKSRLQASFESAARVEAECGGMRRVVRLRSRRSASVTGTLDFTAADRRVSPGPTQTNRAANDKRRPAREPAAVTPAASAPPKFAACATLCVPAAR